MNVCFIGAVAVTAQCLFKILRISFHAISKKSAAQGYNFIQAATEV